MRAVYIIVEGQTEEEFVKSSLGPYLCLKNIPEVRAITLYTSPTQKGGDITYERYRTNISKLLLSQTDIFITSLIDFFKLKSDFPNYHDCKKKNSTDEKITCIENSIKEDLNNVRFLPYIQLHEFEGLLFTDLKGFKYLPEVNSKPSITNRLSEIIAEYPNPELINDGNATAPSKRLQDIIPGYQKKLHGPIIALENGIESIIAKCPRFKNWVNEIISRFPSS